MRWKNTVLESECLAFMLPFKKSSLNHSNECVCNQNSYPAKIINIKFIWLIFFYSSFDFLKDETEN